MSDTPLLRERLVRRYSAASPGNGPRYVLAWEVRNQAGFGGYGGDGRLRTCDLMALDSWQSGPVRLIGHELKASRSDWLRELKDPSKAEAFRPLVAEWWLVVTDLAIVKDGELPPGWGLLAPAGNTMRATRQPLRQTQPEVGPALMSALMRAMQRDFSGELARARMPRPHDRASYPRLGKYESGRTVG